MFVQVIQGRATDPKALRNQWEKWEQDLKPGAVDFLGSTAGIDENGIIIIGSRFGSEEAARKNSDRPEQGEWWQETERFIESPEFYDCKDVDLLNDGGSNDAGFVQVIQGYATSEQAIEDVRKLTTQMEDAMRSHRPDVIGGFVAWGPNLGFSQFVYFTSEAEAREGEKKEDPPEFAEMGEVMSKSVKDMKFIDLREPWLL